MTELVIINQNSNRQWLKSIKTDKTVKYKYG